MSHHDIGATSVLGLQQEIQRSGSRYDHRLHGVLLVAQGMTCPEVARLLGDAPRSVENWVHRFDQQGLAGLTRASDPAPSRWTEVKRSPGAGAGDAGMRVIGTEDAAAGSPWPGGRGRGVGRRAARGPARGGRGVGLAGGGRRGGRRDACAIRLETLTLAQGKVVKFAPHLSSVDSGDSGQKVTGNENVVEQASTRGHDAARIAILAGTGASLGGIADRSWRGAGIGAGAGSAVGLATALLTRGKEVELRQGSTLDVVFDRAVAIE